MTLSAKRKMTSLGRYVLTVVAPVPQSSPSLIGYVDQIFVRVIGILFLHT